MGQSLEGQTVLVTGASRGIGAAIVRQVCQEGGRPILHCNANIAAAEALLAGTGRPGLVVQADLADPAGAFALWERAREAAGRIHAVVNNAGIRSEVSIDAEPAAWQATWHREFQVNLFAAADLCKQAVGHFRAEGGGRIVNVASRAAQRGYAADAIAYGATKAALVNLTKSIALNFAREGITAVAVAPGWVATDMVAELVARDGLEAALSGIPLGRMATPGEVAEIVAFALRPSQQSLNGATLDVNGGSYLR